MSKYDYAIEALERELVRLEEQEKEMNRHSLIYFYGIEIEQLESAIEVLRKA